MAEVVLAAEVGRPTGSRAVRRLRREGRSRRHLRPRDRPTAGGHCGPGAPRRPEQRGGANQLLSLDTGSGTYLALAREMQRHPVAQTVTHVDFVIVRRDEVISADVPIVLVGEALEVHHGDGLVDQQMFTLPINALPTAIPSAIEADISELIIGGQVRVSDLTLPSGVTTDIDPETAVAIGQPPRVVVEEGAGEGEGRRGPRRAGAEPARRGVGRGGQRRGLGPAPPLCPVGVPGDTGGPARRRAGKSRKAEFAGQPAQRRIRCGRAAGRSDVAPRCGPRRASAPVAAVSRSADAGWRSPSRRPT